jgi:hypothetical protein
MKKTIYDQLLDRILLAPAMLASATTLADQPPLVAVRSALALQRQVSEYDADLARFFDGMVLAAELDGGGPLYWEVPDADPLFPVAYRFRDTLTAATLALLWGTRCIAWSGMQHLRRVVRELTWGIEAALLARGAGADPPSSNGAEQPAGQQQQQKPPTAAPSAALAEVRAARVAGLEFQSQCGDPVDMAHNVCRCVAFCISGDAESRTVTAPLNMSFDVLSDWPGNEPVKAWLQARLDTIQNKGMRIMRHLREKTDIRVKGNMSGKD